jgi:hypothetical protein
MAFLPVPPVKTRTTFLKRLRALSPYLGIAAVVIPPGLVVYHRWLLHPDFYDVQNKLWHAIPFLDQLSMPTYFLEIFFLFLLSIYIFVLLALIYKAALPDQPSLTATGRKVSTGIPGWQKKAGTILIVAAGVGLAADVMLSVLHQTISGIEVLGIALLVISGLVLKESRRLDLKQSVVHHAGWVMAYLAVYGTILVILQTLFGEKNHQSGIMAIPIILLAVILLRWYRKIPVILWVSLGALILYTWGLDSWRFSVIGDEHDFYRSAIYILSNSVSEIGRNFFNVIGVFGTHTYLVSLVQAGFMKLFGASNFGWRISNPVFLSAAVVFFFLFFRKFTRTGTALFISGLLACSGYLMNFGKIGYDNPQAFLMLGLTLWLAAEAALSRRTTLYALLGLVMGFCLYSYPAALYILPLPVLLMAIYDLPKQKPDIWRWLWCFGIFCIMATPLLFQPAYGQGKVEGLFIFNLDAIARYGTSFMIGSQLVYSFFSYLYVINESHFIVASHIDPISAIWVPIGLSWLVVQLRRRKFALFWMIGFVLMWFLAGASHGRLFPPNTRMFMLLPWWMSFTAFGIEWTMEWIAQKVKAPLVFKAFPVAIIILISGTNLLQANWVYPRLSAGTPSLEMLFLRLVERAERDPQARNSIYVFVTDESWGLDGIRLLQDLYFLPQSGYQLERIVMSRESLEWGELARLRAANTIIIVQPWMRPEWQAALTPILVEAGKQTCEIRDTADTAAIFTAYLPASQNSLCPINGDWSK